MCMLMHLHALQETRNDPVAIGRLNQSRQAFCSARSNPRTISICTLPVCTRSKPATGNRNLYTYRISPIYTPINPYNP